MLGDELLSLLLLPPTETKLLTLHRTLLDRQLGRNWYILLAWEAYWQQQTIFYCSSLNAKLTATPAPAYSYVSMSISYGYDASHL